jgi:hypothetical protein
MLPLWLRPLRKKLSAAPAESRSACRKRNRLAVELLESRELLSHGVFPGYTLDGAGNLYHDTAAGRMLVDAHVQDFAPAVDGQSVYCLETGGSLRRVAPDGTSPHLVNPNVQDFAPNPADPSSVYVLYRSGKLERSVPGGSPYLINPGVRAFALNPTDPTSVYVLYQNGKFERRVPGTSVYLIDNGVRDFAQTADPREVFEESADGKVWRVAPGDHRVPLRANGLDVIQGTDGSLYTLTASGDLRRYGGPGGDAVLGERVGKDVVAADGSVWVLQANGDLRINGGPARWTNKGDFAFDSQNRVLLLDTAASGGSLTRSKQVYGNGGWDVLGQNVAKWAFDGRGGVWALQTDGKLLVNGSVSWTNKADFAFDARDRVILLDKGGAALARSKQAFGNGGFDSLGQNVAKFQQAANGDWWVLQTDGKLLVNGMVSWTNKADFAFDAQSRAILLDTAANGGSLARSKQAYGSGGWDVQGVGVLKYAQTTDGHWIVLQRDGQVLVDGAMAWAHKTDLSLDAQDRLILLDSSGLLQRSRGPRGTGGWDALGQGVRKYAVVGDRVYSLDTDGWLSVNGTRTWQAVTDFAVDAQGRLIVLHPESWADGWFGREKTPGKADWEVLGYHVQGFQLATDGAVYALNVAKEVYRYGPGTGDSARIGVNVKSLQVAPDGSVYALNTVNEVFRYTPSSGAFSRIGVNVRWFQVAPDGAVYALNTVNEVFRYTPSSGAFSRIGQNVASVQVAPDGAVYALNTVKEVWRYTAASGAFSRIGMNVASFQVAPDGSVYALNTVNEVFRYTPSSGAFSRIGVNVRWFQVAPDGAVYALNTVNEVFRYTTSSGAFNRIGQNVVSFQVAPDGSVYALNTVNEVFRYTPSSGAFSRIGVNVRWFQVAPDGAVYALNTVNEVFRYTPSSGAFSRVGQNVASVQVAPDGAVYALNTVNELWCYTVGSGLFIRIGVSVVSFQVAPDGTVYALNTGYSLYHLTLAGSWEFVAGNVGLFSLRADGSVATEPPAYLDSNGTLDIVGTPRGNDTIRVTWNPLSTLVGNTGPAYTVQINGRSVTTLGNGQFSKIRVLTGDGNTTVNLDNVPVPAEVYTGNGTNYVVGGQGGNLLVAGGGNNTLIGGNGDDVMIAGTTGNDVFDPLYDRTGGNDIYIVPGVGSVDRARYQWRDVFRANGSAVSVREDNKGNDKLEYGGTITASGQLVGFQTDHLDDNGFWSAVGSFIENNLGPVVETVGLAVLTLATDGATGPLLAAVEAGGTNLVGQLVDVAAEGKSFNFGSFLGGIVGSVSGGLFNDFGQATSPFTVGGLESAGGAVQGLTTGLAGSLVSNGVNAALNGGVFNWSAVADGAAGAVASGAWKGWNLLGVSSGSAVDLRALNAGLNGVASSLAVNAVSAAMIHGPFNWEAILAGGAQGVGSDLATAVVEQFLNLFGLTQPVSGGNNSNPAVTSGTPLLDAAELDRLFDQGIAVADAGTAVISAGLCAGTTAYVAYEGAAYLESMGMLVGGPYGAAVGMFVGGIGGGLVGFFGNPACWYFIGK